MHGGKIREGEYLPVWVRDQEYAESELLSGMPARDDGYGRKINGFRYDKNLWNGFGPHHRGCIFNKAVRAYF